MYHYFDRPTASLDRTSAFLLWAIRAGSSALAGRRCIGATLGPGFGRLGLEAALPHFAIGLAVLVREAAQPIRVMAAGCCRVGEHEAMLLALLTAVEPDAERRVGETARILLESAAAADTFTRAWRAMTAAVLAQGLMPAQRDGAAR